MARVLLWWRYAAAWRRVGSPDMSDGMLYPAPNTYPSATTYPGA